LSRRTHAGLDFPPKQLNANKFRTSCIRRASTVSQPSYLNEPSGCDAIEDGGRYNDVMDHKLFRKTYLVKKRYVGPAADHSGVRDTLVGFGGEKFLCFKRHYGNGKYEFLLGRLLFL
jgi:hypothetical protein